MTPRIGLSTDPMVVATRARAAAGRRVLRLHGGYVVLDPAGEQLSAVLERLARRWRDRHVTVVLDTPRDSIEKLESELPRAVRAFDRVVLCGCDDSSSAETAARLARSIRNAGRVDCQLVAEPRRALRHCIDSMIPGDVIAWCCNAHTSAVDILEEYGAIVVDNAGEEGFDACAGTAVALHGAAGASAYS